MSNEVTETCMSKDEMTDLSVVLSFAILQPTIWIDEFRQFRIIDGTPEQGELAEKLLRDQGFEAKYTETTDLLGTVDQIVEIDPEE